MSAGEFYLGDGLYVSVDPYGTVILRAPRDGGDHWVGLESETVIALLGFFQMVYDENLKSEEVRGRISDRAQMYSEELGKIEGGGIEGSDRG